MTWVCCWGQHNIFFLGHISEHVAHVFNCVWNSTNTNILLEHYYQLLFTQLCVLSIPDILYKVKWFVKKSVAAPMVPRQQAWTACLALHLVYKKQQCRKDWQRTEWRLHLFPLVRELVAIGYSTQNPYTPCKRFWKSHMGSVKFQMHLPSVWFLNYIYFRGSKYFIWKYQNSLSTWNSHSVCRRCFLKE